MSLFLSFSLSCLFLVALCLCFQNRVTTSDRGYVPVLLCDPLWCHSLDFECHKKSRHEKERKRWGSNITKKRLSKRILASSFAQERNVLPFRAFTRIRVSDTSHPTIREAILYKWSCRQGFKSLPPYSSWLLSKFRRQIKPWFTRVFTTILTLWTKQVFIMTFGNFYLRANILFLQRLKQSDKRNNLVYLKGIRYWYSIFSLKNIWYYIIYNIWLYCNKYSIHSIIVK